ATQASLGAHLARDARDLVGEGVELVDHGVDGLLELEDLAADVDGDLLREVAVGDTGRDLGDVADLAGQVAGHQVDVVRQVFPSAPPAPAIGLAAEPALGADLARDARHLAGERVELPDHGVDSLGGAQELALKRPAVDLQRHGLRQIAVGDGTDNAGDLGVRPREVFDEVVDGIERARPCAAGVDDAGTLDLTFLADMTVQAPDLVLQTLVRLDDRVESRRDFAGGARPIAGHARDEIAALDCRQDAEHDLAVELSAGPVHAI